MARTTSKVANSFIWNRAFYNFLSKRFESRWYSPSSRGAYGSHGYQLSIVHDCADKRKRKRKRKSLNIFFGEFTSSRHTFLRTNSRSTCYFHGFYNPIVFDFWSQLLSRTWCIFVCSRLFSSFFPLPSSFTATHFRVSGRAKHRSLSTLALSPWTAESSNLPSPRTMIEFRLVRAVTYNLRPDALSTRFNFNPRQTWQKNNGCSKYVLITDYCREIFLFRCLGRGMIYGSPTWAVLCLGTS